MFQDLCNTAIVVQKIKIFFKQSFRKKRMANIEMSITPQMYPENSEMLIKSSDDVIFIRYVQPTLPKILRDATPGTPPIILREEQEVPDLVMLESDNDDDDPSSDWEME